MNEQTIAELRRIWSDTPGQIRLDMTFATSHNDRLAALEKAINYVAQELSKTRQYRQHKDEDLLTADLIQGLKGCGIAATHDTAFGGHVDVVVEAKDDFLWLGEAKVHSSYEWLHQGFLQLSTRYSTGLPGQDHGGLIIYCYNKRADKVMDAWKLFLSERHADLLFSECKSNRLIFRTEHAHQSTGLPFKIKHLPVILHFAPQDK